MVKTYKIWNSVFGWLSFIIASAVYLMTMEPTASFWDCGEFISTAFKLEVGHPPGAAFFMILGRLFTMFAGGNVEHAAIWMNSMSALASGFTILFLFWTITHLVRKLLIKNESDYTLGNIITIIGSGLVGALAYTFSDTFWFSAVEAEVYASSSLFTAIVFWAILKWEERADQPHSNRWLILIAYLMGLSIGVHLLNLLAIPAIVFVYYFKKYPVTTKGIIATLAIAIVILAIVMYGMIQGLVVIASKFELLFVNTFGLPFSSGVIFYIILLIALIVWGIYYSHKKSKIWLNTAFVMLTVLIIGYSSVAMIVIRSSADTPLDENDPDNMFSLLAYLNREQYGDRPLLYGPVYNAPVIEVEEGKPTYTPINGRYEITNRKPEYKYDERFMMFFPRMFSPDADHVKAYQYWGKIKGIPLQAQNNQGELKTINKPTFTENLRFFWRYQIIHMYWRYFMWNFSGRQNDIQGFGEPNKGNWISGIKFIDQARLGPQDDLPDSITQNKGNNKYYMLPFLLGLLGLIYHLIKNKNDFIVVMLLFFFTGIAIVLYLNQTPYQPRERDYAYAGSFYAYAIWIGIGVFALIDSISKQIKGTLFNVFVVLLCLLIVPGIMAKENWDDHDRSNRYTARDFASNYLNSCEPNAIIFTNGDNDTFPLWYAQEVEGIRTDVRVINLSYLSADWYLEQMHRKQYKSDPVPFRFTRDDVLQGKRDVIYLIERIKDYVDLKQALDFVASDDPETKKLPNYSERIDYIPAKKFIFNVDTASVFANRYVTDKEKKQVVTQMKWAINRNYLTKADLLVLDLLVHNNWKRPIYFAVTVSHENYLNLLNYLQINGMTYKIVPIYSEAQMGDIQSVNIDTTYNNIMNKFRWGGINNPKVYLDENNLRMLSNMRNIFAKLANALILANKKDSALKVVDRAMEVMPDKCVPFNYFVLPFVDIYYRLNQTEKAEQIVNRLSNIASKELKYIYKLKPEDRELLDYDIRVNMHILQQLFMMENQYGNKEKAKQLEATFNDYYSRFIGS